MKKSRRLPKKLREQAQKREKFLKQASLPTLLFVSLIFLFVAHFKFDKYFWLFIIGLILFSFTTSFLIVAMLEHFLPSALVNHKLWSGIGNAGRGLGGLIAGILAILIALGTMHLLKIMNADYIS